jgi:hypothetical protein
MHNERVNRRDLAIAAAVTVIMLVGTALISITTATADIYSSALTSCIWLQYYKIKNTKAV